MSEVSDILDKPLWLSIINVKAQCFAIYFAQQNLHLRSPSAIALGSLVLGIKKTSIA
jgi:hypothetical protein